MIAELQRAEEQTNEVATSFVPKEHAGAVWPKIEAYVESATRRTGGRYLPADVLIEILEGRMLLWIAFEGEEVIGVAVSYFIDYPRKKVLAVPFMAGEDFVRWGDSLLKLLRKWAFDNGCGTLEACARPGWARVFKDEGYKRLWEWCEVPVNGGSSERN